MNTPILSSLVIEFSPKDTKIYQIVGHLCTDVVNILKLVRCVLVGFSNEKRNCALNNFRSLAKKKKKKKKRKLLTYTSESLEITLVK